MMDGTLTIVSHELMKMVTKLNRKSLGALESRATTMCPEGNRKSQESFTVPVYVSHVDREETKEGKREREEEKEKGTRAGRKEGSKGGRVQGKQGREQGKQGRKGEKKKGSGQSLFSLHPTCRRFRSVDGSL